jgi:FlaA1/EpsC-like NDP-sugar epimerase
VGRHFDTTDDHSNGSALGHFLERNRTPVQVIIDVVCWSIGLGLAQVLRFEFTFSSDRWGRFTVGGLLAAMLIAAIAQLIGGLLVGLYRHRWHYGSFEEVSHLVRTVAVATVLLAVVNQLTPRQLVPTSVTLAGGALTLGAMAAARYVWRLILERGLRPSQDRARPVVIVGAGESGNQVVTSMLRSPDSPYLPVALLDDDPAKSKLSLRGVPVVGDHTDVARAARELGASTIVVAIPSAPRQLLQAISTLALDHDLDVRVLPKIDDIFGAPVGLSDLRPLSELDLLGRHQIDTDVESIAGYLTGRRVLVTGAGGSIGSELCRQIDRFAPERLVMVDRDESALHGVQLLLEGRATLDDPRLVVADIRDRDRMREVMAEARPEVVFHAAALKHLPLLEMHPGEAVKTNVAGTANVLDAAAANGVGRFVNISTDKAANPRSVLGTTKRIAECITADRNGGAGGVFLSVRFGNVLGSSGSVLRTFRAQIDAGGPVTVTDPDVTRYFMTVEEAVQLVIQAGAVGGPGEALVLDMGQPVRIADVARRLVARQQRGRPVDIVFTGLRPGEKLHEDLFGDGETDRRPAHPLISHVRVPPLRAEEVLTQLDDLTPEQLAGRLAQLAPVGEAPIGRHPGDSGRTEP